MGKRTIYCGWCGKEHGEDSSILKTHQDKIANDPRSYGKPVELYELSTADIELAGFSEDPGQDDFATEVVKGG
jgi:hypothetical protein